MTDPDKKRRRRIGRVWLAVSLLGSILLLYLFSQTWFFTVLAWRQARGTQYEATVIRWHLAHNGSPVERALADRSIDAGQSVDEVVAAHGPFRVTTAGRYQELRPAGEVGLMFEGYRIVARDGRLVGAGWWTCTGSLEFFNTMTREEWEACNSAFRNERERRYLARVTPRMAIAGSLAYIQPSPPEPVLPDGPPIPSAE
jgi:hypothetical protein